MSTHDPDPDVVRWGIYHINVCAIPNVGSGSIVTQYETDGSEVGYISEGYDGSVAQHETGRSQLWLMREGYDEVLYTNLAVIACAFQEELSQVATAKASGMYNSEKVSIVQQNWLSHHGRHATSGDNKDQQGRDGESKNQKQVDERWEKEEENKGSIKMKSKEGGEMLISSPSLNGLEMSNYSVDTLFGSLDIVDESALDGELGKRLNDIARVPHVPKINGELPFDEEISDHQRLLEGLQLYDLVETKVQGDGNCQEGYVPMAYDNYLKKMSKTGEWVDHVTLRAAADWFGVKIFVITSFKDTCYIEILPSMLKSKRDMPHVEKKKKKWWML